MQRFKITHTTTYQYEAEVSLCYNEGQRLPRSCDLPLFHQQCLTATLKAEPNWDDQRERLDFFGNRVTYFTLRQPHEKMALTANSEVVVTPTFAARHQQRLHPGAAIVTGRASHVGGSGGSAA